MQPGDEALSTPFSFMKHPAKGADAPYLMMQFSFGFLPLLLVLFQTLQYHIKLL